MPGAGRGRLRPLAYLFGVEIRGVVLVHAFPFPLEGVREKGVTQGRPRGTAPALRQHRSNGFPPPQPPNLSTLRRAQVMAMDTEEAGFGGVSVV